MDAAIHRHTLLEIFTSHRQELVGYAASIVGEHPLAEDVVQSAYFRIVDATDKWQPDKPLEEPVGYLYRIIRNLSIDERRRLRRSTPTGQDADVSGIDRVAENQPNPETVAIARNELMILQAALDELPARTRKAFELHRFAGLKLVDIAAHLDISVGTAHTLVAQALDHCRQRLLRGQQT